MLFPGIGFTRASCVAIWIMNGVPWILSAGSSQAGTSVVCTAQVICPDGASAAPTAGGPRAQKAMTNSDASGALTWRMIGIPFLTCPSASRPRTAPRTRSLR